jgi:hypothetical protein
MTKRIGDSQYFGMRIIWYRCKRLCGQIIVRQKSRCNEWQNSIWKLTLTIFSTVQKVCHFSKHIPRIVMRKQCKIHIRISVELNTLEFFWRIITCNKTCFSPKQITVIHAEVVIIDTSHEILAGHCVLWVHYWECYSQHRWSTWEVLTHLLRAFGMKIPEVFIAKDWSFPA